MGRKAKHHYIPKCYLKGFTYGGENSSKFLAIPKNNDAIFPTTPNDACAKRDYYTVDHSNSLIIENFYAEHIEPKIAKVLGYISQHSKLPEKEEMRNLILLLSTLYLRVPAFRENLEMPMRRTKEIVEDMSKYVRVSNKEEFNYNQTDLIQSELRLIDTVQESLANKYYQLYVINDDDINVVTSDNPFILCHPNVGNNFHFGLGAKNIEICVPLTKKAILICKNEPINEGTFIASKVLVALANTKIIFSANRFFYSPSDEFVLLDDDLNVYSHNAQTKTNKKIQVTPTAHLI